MELKQAFKFFEEANKNVVISNERLNKAVGTLAQEIVKRADDGEYVTVNGTIYKVINQSSNIGYYKYLACNYTEDDWTYGHYYSLQDTNDFYLHGQFNSVVNGSTREMRLKFAKEAIQVIQEFAKKWDRESSENNSASEIAEDAISKMKRSLA